HRVANLTFHAAIMGSDSNRCGFVESTAYDTESDESDWSLTPYENWCGGHGADGRRDRAPADRRGLRRDGVEPLDGQDRAARKRRREGCALAGAACRALRSRDQHADRRERDPGDV